VLYKKLSKSISITKYIFKSISITFVEYFGQVAQNSKYF